MHKYLLQLFSIKNKPAPIKIYFNLKRNFKISKYAANLNTFYSCYCYILIYSGTTSYKPHTLFAGTALSEKQQEKREF